LLHEDFNSETVLAINHHNCYGDGPLFDVMRTCDVIQIYLNEQFLQKYNLKSAVV